MNAAKYLVDQGWRGEGHSLDDANRGLARPILTGRHRGAEGLGTSTNTFTNQWWLRAWEPLNSEVRAEPHEGSPTGISITKRPSLYAHFTKPQVLAGTRKTLHTGPEQSISESEQASKEIPNSDARPGKKAPHLGTRKEAAESIMRHSGVKDHSKKRKQFEAHVNTDAEPPRKLKKEKRKALAVDASDPPSELAVNNSEQAQAKEKSEGDPESNLNSFGAIHPQRQALMNGYSQGESRNRKDQQPEKSRRTGLDSKSSEGKENVNRHINTVDTKIAAKKERKSERRNEAQPSSTTNVNTNGIHFVEPPTNGDSSHSHDKKGKKRKKRSVEEDKAAPGFGAEPVDSKKSADKVEDVSGAHSVTEMDASDRPKRKRAEPITATLDGATDKNRKFSKKDKKARFNYVFPSQDRADTSKGTADSNSTMNPARAAMIATDQKLGKPTPTGGLDDKGRRTFVINDFLPFCVGSEHSQRKALKRGKPIKRSPRSIRHEARALMQKFVIQLAVERGEEPPKFEKPKTRRELREENKAKKRTPEARALKLRRKILMRQAGKERKRAVKALEEQGKYEEARELKRTPLFPPEEKPEKDTKELEKQVKDLEEENEEGDNVKRSDGSDDDGDSSTDPGSVTDSGSSTDEISSYSGSEDEELDPEQRGLIEEARRQRKAERRAKNEAKKAALQENPKTKRQKREERFAAMPEAPPPLLAVPKIETITDGIRLPHTNRTGTLKELRIILADTGLTEEEQQAYIHKALVDRQEESNIKQSRRAALRRDRGKKKKSSEMKHRKHVALLREMTENRRAKQRRRDAGEFVETSSEKKQRHRQERDERDKKKAASKLPIGEERGVNFIPI
ncbi:MAG: hypothetical protein Q9162_004544 [Coniocarpon cinnabarinum]